MLTLLKDLITKVGTLAPLSALTNLVNTSTKSDRIGINTNPDSTNKLAVKSNEILFAADTPNGGSLRSTLNKDAIGDSALHQFKTNYSLRAEFGLNASDDFSLKVSPDGSTFKESWKVDKTTGNMDFKQNVQKNGVDLTTIEQINLTVTNVIEIAQAKPTVDGLYVFKVTPTDGLPSGVAIGDIAKYVSASGIWSLYMSNFNAPNVINSGPNKYAYFKESGTFTSLTEKIGAVPIGTVFSHLGYSAPENYVLLNGTTLSKTAYYDLWTFAQANNLTTTNTSLTTKFIDLQNGNFKVPDFRGYFIRGLDNTGLIDVDGSGRGIADIQADDFKSHDHDIARTNSSSDGEWPAAGYQNIMSGDRGWTYTNLATAGGNHQFIGSRGGSETRPKNLTANYIIKALNSISAQQIVAGQGVNLTQLPSGNIQISNTGVAPAGYIYGLTLSNSTVSPLTKIDIAAGTSRDTTDFYDLKLASSITKDLAVAWTSGSGNGGRASSISLTNGSQWFVFIISNGSNTDVYFDTDKNAANKPSGYTYYRRIGAVYYISAASGIMGFIQKGSFFLWTTPITSSALTPTTAATSITLGTPVGIETEARINVSFPDPGSGSYGNFGLFSSLAQTDITPSPSNANVQAQRVSGAFVSQQSVTLEILTNTTSQIRSRFTTASPSYYVTTVGYNDVGLGV